MEYSIEAEGLSKIYVRGREKIHALTDIGLSIAKGDFCSIVGPSGSGKTTLLNLIGCLDAPTSGRLKIKGVDVTGLPENKMVRLRRNYMGFVFQQFFLIPTLTVYENIELPLLFSKKKAARSKINSILKMVGLEDRARHLPSQLSGGEMQRAAIGRALVNEPEIIFADEPTGNLDSTTGRGIFHLFKEMNREGITVVVITHNRELADMTNSLIHLLDGRISEDDKKDSREADPSNGPVDEPFAIIKTENLSKTYRSGKRKVKVIENLSFNAKKGECVLIRGPSGSGKTTLLNLLGALARPSEGRVYIYEKEISRFPDYLLTPFRREKIGFIFQQFNLISGYTAAQNVMLPLIPLGIRVKEREQRAWEILLRLGLRDRFDFRVSELSGGEQQRVTIARALINKPGIILADEPTSNIDEDNAKEVIKILKQLKDEGKTIVIASHDPLIHKWELVDRSYHLGKRET